MGKKKGAGGSWCGLSKGTKCYSCKLFFASMGKKGGGGSWSGLSKGTKCYSTTFSLVGTNLKEIVRMFFQNIECSPAWNVTLVLRSP